MRDGRPRPPLWWLFGDLLRVEPLHLQSPLAPDDARRALETLGLNVLPGASGGMSLRGRIVGNRVVATARTMLNSLDNPYAFGRIEPSTSGSELRGEIRTTRLARVVAPAMALVWAVAAVWVATQGGLTLSSTLGAAVLGLAAVAMGHLASWIVRPDWANLREQLSEALHATDVSEVTGEPPV